MLIFNYRDIVFRKVGGGYVRSHFFGCGKNVNDQ